MARYLITGGCGFIGSTLADALVARGNDVRILDDLSTGDAAQAPAGADLVIGDVANAALVADALDGMDGCYHLAAVASVPRSHEDWMGTHATNLTGTIAVFDAARRRRTPVVYASSAAVYGCNPRCPLDETAAPLPLSAYGADKLGCELHAAVAGHAHGVPTTGFRFFNVYGPRQNPSSPYSGVISIFCDRLLAGRSLTVHGDGEQVRDFVYVDDVVRFLIAAMEHPSVRPQVFNVCTGKPTSIRALAGILADSLGVRPTIETGPERPGDIRASVGDPTAAGRAFGLAASTDLRTGLTRTAASLKATKVSALYGLPQSEPGAARH